MLRRAFLIALAFCALAPLSIRGQGTQTEEADLLASLLNWQPGAVVADVGAGDGKLTVIVASKFVGATGKVYSTELDAGRLAHLDELAAKATNITALTAGVRQTNLPRECCDSIYMRLVYHHLTRPAEIGASLFQSLKPAGLLAVIDQEPVGTSIPEGVPKNRVGHGVPQKVLIDELTAAGFQVVTARDDWPGRKPTRLMYVVVFRKPAA